MRATPTTPVAALARAAQLHPFLDFFEDIGVPIQENISRYPLPPGLRENGNMLAASAAMFAFVADMARKQGVDDITPSEGPL